MRKYRSTPTVIDGIRFDSKKEAARYEELKMLQRFGEIKFLRIQPKFPLFVNRVKVCTYIADFEYWNDGEGGLVIEDVKGVKTPMYRLKKKMFEAQYSPLRITET